MAHSQFVIGERAFTVTHQRSHLRVRFQIDARVMASSKGAELVIRGFLFATTLVFISQLLGLGLDPLLHDNDKNMKKI